MAAKFALSPRVLSDPFWDGVLAAGEELAPERAQLAERLKGLESLRAAADYNTGSISLTAAWCLYMLVRRFGFGRVIEVGTFIGKSTLAMASAMDDAGQPGEVFTCDASNRLTLPWTGRTQITQFQGATSTQMLGQLTGVFDFVFLDGRAAREDLPLLDALTPSDVVVALDDFEGVEKGVANLSALTTLAKFRSHVVLYPPSAAVLQKHGLASYSLTAVLWPVSGFHFARQG